MKYVFNSYTYSSNIGSYQINIILWFTVSETKTDIAPRIASNLFTPGFSKSNVRIYCTVNEKQTDTSMGRLHNKHYCTVTLTHSASKAIVLPLGFQTNLTIKNQPPTQGFYLIWENSRHLATLPLVSLPNDIWETITEIPYWWWL